MKRIFDVVASGLGLIVLSPLFLILAIWIKLILAGRCFIGKFAWEGTIRTSGFSSFARCGWALTREAW